MKLLKTVRVENFRSLRDFWVDDLGDATPFIGANGVGKSNLFRALNLFFTDQVEPGVELDLQRDFHNPRSKRQKVIRVTVVLCFPDEFHLHRSLRPAAQQAGFKVPTPDPMAVQKIWSFDAASRRVVQSFTMGPSPDSLTPPTDEQQRVLESILGLIRYRYIPNHAHPVRIIDEEESEVRNELLSRLKRRSAYRDYQEAVGGPTIQRNERCC